MKILYDAERQSVEREFSSIIPFCAYGNKTLEQIRKEDAEKRSLKRKREATQAYSSKKVKEAGLRADTVDEVRNYLRVVDFENPKEKGDSEKKSKISSFSIGEANDGKYLMFHRLDGSFRVFNSLWDILHLIDRDDLVKLYMEVLTYFEVENIEPSGVGLVLYGDLTTLWETEETNKDSMWENQENW